MTVTLPLPQSPFLDIRWRGRGQLDLLGVSFASLKEQVNNEVGSAGVCWEGKGYLSGDCGWLGHLDPNPYCLYSGGNDCSKRHSSSQIHCTGDVVDPSGLEILTDSWTAEPQPEFLEGVVPAWG